MSHPYHHALSSVKKFGGTVNDYTYIHAWFDESKSAYADFRHRALRHHSMGIFQLERLFGSVIVNSDNKEIPIRLIGEQHIIEDLGRIPSIQDWYETIVPKEWMYRNTTMLSKELSNAQQ